jgi:hypothetical protein
MIQINKWVLACIMLIITSCSNTHTIVKHSIVHTPKKQVVVLSEIDRIQAFLFQNTTKDSAIYLLRVIRNETANLQSNVFNTTKNICGMRYPHPKLYKSRRRDKNQYVVYNNVEDSAKDLLTYVRYYGKRSSYHTKAYKTVVLRR